MGIKAQYWLNREMQFREKLARLEQEDALAYAEEWVRQQPFKYLKKCGYIKSDKPGPAMVKEALEFYGVVNPDRWQARYVDDYASARYRKSIAHQDTLASMAAWLRMGELEMQKLPLPEYNKDLFKKVLQEVKILVQHHPADFAEQLQRKCAATGVAVIYSMCLPKAPVSGATRWFRDNPMIQMTDRHKTNDHFWFTFYHEAGHVLLHGRKEVFLEDYAGGVMNEEKEEEANRFAMKWLLPEKAIEELPFEFDDQDIIRLAHQYKTHPAIVIGRLQRMGILGYNQRNVHKAPVHLF
jgi:Zn-dependent peptidase ImmA (M78 family)